MKRAKKTKFSTRFLHKLLAVWAISSLSLVGLSPVFSESASANTGATSTVDNYLTITTGNYVKGPDNNTFPNLSTNATWEAWIYPTSGSGLNTFMAKEYSFAFSNYNGVYHWAFGNGSAWSNPSWYSTSIAARLNEWQHVAFVKEGTALRFYLNGALAYEVTLTFSSLASSNSLFLIGARFNGTELFSGRVDEVRVWNTARTSSNISEWMNKRLAGNESNLLGYWDFNEPSGSTVYNRVSGQSDLTFQGSPARTDVKTVTSGGGNTVVTFPRTYLPGVGGWTPPSGVTNFDVVVVGGGGGGGSRHAGGGGAGGFISSSLTLYQQAYPIVVGTGGRGGVEHSNASNPGSTSMPISGGSSSAFSLTALGGGAGASSFATAQAGGSGGGGNGGATAAAGTAGQGNAGGNGYGSGGWSGGGGGGAGGAGVASSGNYTGGAGGAGATTQIRGTSETFAAGGGGGGTTAGGSGGSGGGGAGGGGTSKPNGVGKDATSFGSGGGGGSYDNGNTNFAGGAGYQGVVIVRYTITFTITYEYNGADGGTRPATATYTEGGQPITLPTPSRLGYVFGGWYAEAGLSTLVGAAGASYSPTAATTLYAKWTNTLIVDLDATQATSYPGSGTTWSNIAPGASPASATLDSAGMYSSQFGGVMDTTSNRKAVTAAKSLALDNSVGFTMEVWVRFNRVDTAQGVASYDGGGGYINFYKPGNSGMRWEVSGYNAIIDSTVVATNTWYHYVGTCKNNTAVLYRNGVEAVSAARACTTSQNAEFLVGNIQGIPMDGSISLFRFYASALSADEVLARFNSTKARTTYTITYDYDSADGGNSSASATYAVGGSAIVLPTPTKTNNSFTGWYSDPSKTVLVGNAGASYTPSGASSGITLYAKWTSTASTVTFNANDGSGSPATSTQSISNGVATALTSNAFTRTGYTFAGWNTLANGNGTNYTNQQSVTLSENLTLYAKWTANTYTVTYNSNGGSAASNGSFTVGGDGLTLPTVTKAGYIFVGWYESADFTGAKLTSPYLPSQTRTVYARWISISPPIDVGATAGNGSVTVTWSAPASAPSEQPSAYRVEYSTTGTGSWTTADSTISSSTRSYQITGLTNNTKYYVRVAAIYAGVTGAYGYPWTLIFETTTPNRVSGSIVYTSTNGLGGNDIDLTRTDFSRVRYYVGAKYSGSASRNYVDANFDKSLSNPGSGSETYDSLYRLQVPLETGGTQSQFAIHGNIGNLDVVSNVAAVKSAVGLSGRLEIWPWNYNPVPQAGLSGSTQDNTFYDDGDSWSGSGPYGSFQLHNIGAGQQQTVFAWNAHYSTNSSAVEIGFGTNTEYADPGPNKIHPDWTFASRDADYPARSDFLFQSYANLSVTPIGTYIVTFNANDASGSPATSTQSITAGSATALTSNSFTRNGYTFSGWNTAANGSGTSYTDGQSVTISGGLTLYAQWQRISIEAVGDTHVVSGTGGNTNYGTNTQLLFKNATNSTSSAFNRVAYAKFTYDAALNWSGAALEVYVSNNTDGSLNNGYNRTYTTFNVDVFAASDASWDESTLTFNLANSSNQGWGLNTSVWPWNPDTATYLGTISIPTSSSTVGQKFALSNSALDTFLNADSDGAVTFYFRRSDVDGQANLAFASRENTSYPGPTLLVAEAGYTYTVAYDINGGTGTLPASGTYTQGGNAYTIAATTGITPPANKTLAGWNTSKDGTGTDYAPGDSYSTASSLTLYAKYVSSTYTVTYNYNGATSGASVASGSYTTGGSNLVLPTPSKTGYTFGGWYDNSGFTGSALASSITTNASKTIYAKWVAATYTVLYEYNGATSGNSAASDTYTTGSTTITLPTPTRAGYNFAGWFEASDFAGDQLTSPYTTSQNRTLYAKWTAINYRVIYNANNVVGGNTITPTSGSVPVNSTNYTIGQSAPVSANTGSLARNGYTFVGWVTNPAGTGTAINSGSSLTFSASDISLYPKWSANTYAISYNLNGGTGSLAGAPTSWTAGNDNVTLPSTGFTKTGFEFDGWSQTQNGSKLAYRFYTLSDVTLYARWTIKSISYTFSKGAAGDSAVIANWPSDSAANFGSSVVLPDLRGTVVTVNSQSYYFFGWKVSGTVYQPGASFILGETSPVFEADWVRVYDVRYGFGGGSHSVQGDGEAACQTAGLCTENQPITLRSAPTRSGYDFAGWKVQEKATVKAAGASHTVKSDEYLFYAQWTPIDYVFSFNSTGGSNLFNPQNKNIGQLITFPNPGTRSGYSFAGWSADSGTTKYAIGSVFQVGSEGKSFSGYWVPDIYSVSFDWQGAIGTPTPDASYTVGGAAMTLPTQGDMVRDGYTFGGWALTPGGNAVSNFKPTENTVLYAIWNDGNYTLTYNGQGASFGSGPSLVGRGQTITLPTPVREGFVFNGWYDDATAGTKIGNGGSSYSPTRTKTLYARWVQKSLWGVDPAKLESANEYTASSNTAVDTTLTHTPSGTTARVKVPAGALPNGTKINVQYFKDTERQSQLIDGDNSYFFSVLVSWLSGTGNSATVPRTNSGKPIEVTLTNDSIKAGAMVYMVIGDQVTELGRATQNGTVTVELTEDPEIVVAATVPGAPASVVVAMGDEAATISWAAPSTNGGAPITTYTVTASPGPATCTTSTTSCTITGLTNGTTYTFKVVANNSVGASAEASSSSITPAATSYTVTFNSNGGSSVANSSFTSGNSVSEPSAPTRSGYTFSGWSTTLNDVATKVTFPYTPESASSFTLYALWTQAQNNGGSGSGGSGNGSNPTPTPTPTPGPTPSPGPGGGGSGKPVPPPSEIGFTPTPPTRPVIETGPVGNIAGSSEKLTVVADAPGEKIIASAGSWKLEIQPPATSEQSKPVGENLELRLPVAAKTQISGNGLRPNSVVEAWIFSEPTYVGTIKVGSDGSFASSLNLPKSLLPGQHTLQIGSLNADGKLVTLSIPITIQGSVTVGTFKGFVAIFTKDLQGQELTAKVAGKWIKQNPIKNFKSNSYSRLVRFTGAGYDIVIDIYINKKFYKRYTTRTR